MRSDAISVSKLKIGRAKEHLNALQLAVDCYASTELCKLIPKTDGEKILEVRVYPPAQIAVLAGEVLYHLRSTLDYLAFDLVKANKSCVRLRDDWARVCEFPLLLHVPEHLTKKGVNPPLPYSCFGRTLPGIPPPAFKFIERLQPYNSGEGPHNILRLLAKLSNVDKHRHLNLVIPKVAVTRRCRTDDGYTGNFVRGGLKDGAVVSPDMFPDSARADVETSLSPYVTFDEEAISAGPATLELQEVLKLCLNLVESVIIPAFEQFLATT
jgi:hypothetical protein